MTSLTARQLPRGIRPHVAAVAPGRDPRLIDIATLFLTHGLMALALWRLLPRDELDAEEGAPPPRKPWLKPSEGDSG